MIRAVYTLPELSLDDLYHRDVINELIHEYVALPAVPTNALISRSLKPSVGLPQLATLLSCADLDFP